MLGEIGLYLERAEQLVNKREMLSRPRMSYVMPRQPMERARGAVNMANVVK
jgi:hypothetical protein